MPDLSDNSRGPDRERLLTLALREVVAELRLVDVADYIAFLRMDIHGNIADILDSSSQLHLAPGALTFSDSGEARVGWSTPPVVELDLCLKDGVTEVHFRLTLAAAGATIRIDHFPRLGVDEGDAAQTARLKKMLETVRIVPARH